MFNYKRAKIFLMRNKLEEKPLLCTKHIQSNFNNSDLYKLKISIIREFLHFYQFRYKNFCIPKYKNFIILIIFLVFSTYFASTIQIQKKSLQVLFYISQFYTKFNTHYRSTIDQLSIRSRFTLIWWYIVQLFIMHPFTTWIVTLQDLYKVNFCLLNFFYSKTR